MKTKEEIADFINNKYIDKIYASFSGNRINKELRIPVYRSRFKKIIIEFIAKIKKSRPFDDDVSYYDYSKIIPPDNWIKYTNSRCRMAIPKYIEEHDYCWLVFPVAEFQKENLKYGIKPQEILFKTALIGGISSILIDKETLGVYPLGSPFFDWVEDFTKCKQGLPSQRSWKTPFEE